MEHYGRERIIFIGPQAQEILLRYLARDTQAFCFQPRDSESKRLAGRSATRKVPLGYGNRPGSNRKSRPKRKAGVQYIVAAYRRAIARACDVAFPHPTLSAMPKEKLTAEQRAELKKWQSAHRWSPNQLRHAAATEISKRYGVEASRVTLGHADLKTTLIYAERDAALAARVAKEVG
jgi:site-specific recombinase XerD